MLPENVGTGEVVGRFLAVRTDETEPNAIPDRNLRFRFAPNLEQQFLRDVAAATVLRFDHGLLAGDAVRPFEAGVDDEGYLINLRTLERGMPLVATDDPDVGVVDWTWRVDFLLDGRVVKTVSVFVPTGGVVDLATAIPVPPSPGEALQDWILAVEAVQQIADSTIVDGEVAGGDLLLTRKTGEVFNAGRVQGAAGPKGDKGDPGAPGADGVDGADGAPGAPGPKGDVGGQGIQGETGPAGAKGDKGDPGPGGPLQDTGWRDITATMSVAPASGKIYVRRVGSQVSVRFDALIFAATGSGTVATLPVGFRPRFTEANTVRGISNIAQITVNGFVQLYDRGTARSDGGINLTTDDAWPATMPGIAV